MLAVSSTNSFARHEEDGAEGMGPDDVAAAVQLLGLKLCDVTPRSPPVDQLDFEIDALGGATVRITVTFKHGYLPPIGVYPELTVAHFC